MTNDKDINWRIVLDHMHAMEKRLKEEMQKGFKGVNTRFDEIEKRLENLEQDVFVLVAQRKAHEEQLERIEKVKLPKMRKSISRLNKRLSNHIVSPTPHPALQA